MRPAFPARGARDRTRPPPEVPNRPSFRRSSRARRPGPARSRGPTGAAEPPSPKPPSPKPPSPGRLFRSRLPGRRLPRPRCSSPAPSALPGGTRARRGAPREPRRFLVGAAREPRVRPVPSPPGTGDRAASGTSFREGTIRPLTPVRPRTGHRVEGVLTFGAPAPRTPPAPSARPPNPAFAAGPPPVCARVRLRRLRPALGGTPPVLHPSSPSRFAIPVRHPVPPSGATPNEGGPAHGSGAPFLRRGGAVLFVPDFVERGDFGDFGDFLRRGSPPIFLRFAPGRGALAAATVVARACRREPEDANFAALRRPQEPGVRNRLRADPPAPIRPARTRTGPARDGAPPGREGTANARID